MNTNVVFEGGGERELNRILEENSSMKRGIDVLNEDKQRLQRQHDSLLKELELRKERELDYEKRLIEFDKEKLTLKNDLITLLKDSENAMQEDEMEIKRLREEVSMLKRRFVNGIEKSPDLSALISENDLLKQERDRLRIVIDERILFEDEMKEQTSKLKKLEFENESLQKENESLKKDLKGFISEFEQLMLDKETKKSLEKELISQRLLIEGLHEEKGHLQRQLKLSENSNDEMKILESQISTMSEMIKEMETISNQRETENGRLQESILQLKNELHKYVEEKFALEERLRIEREEHKRDMSEGYFESDS